ncbi:hypothetical protein D3C72_1455760 [compost metagenome]
MAGRVIRAADENHFHAVKILGDGREIKLPVIQRQHVATRHAKRFGAYAVHAVSRLAIEHRVFARLAEGADQQFDTFISPTADQHLLRLHARVLRVILNYRLWLALRITVQRLLGKLERDCRREFIGI